jgi:hypothetical protein
MVNCLKSEDTESLVKDLHWEETAHTQGVMLGTSTYVARVLRASIQAATHRRGRSVAAGQRRRSVVYQRVQDLRQLLALVHRDVAHLQDVICSKPGNLLRHFHDTHRIGKTISSKCNQRGGTLLIFGSVQADLSRRSPKAVLKSQGDGVSPLQTH